MPEASTPVVETGSSLAGNGAELAPLTGFRNMVNGQFTRGNPGGPGRPKGYAKAAAMLDRSAPSLTQDLIRRSKKSDKLLAKAIDKILPDAGKESSTLNLSLNYAALTIPATSRPTTRMGPAVPSERSTTSEAEATLPSLSSSSEAED